MMAPPSMTMHDYIVQTFVWYMLEAYNFKNFFIFLYVMCLCMINLHTVFIHVWQILLK
jgi:hypothetical protein